MAREPFVWGQGGAQLTPRQLEERRKVALALMAKGADFSPAGHWTEALGRAFNGWWGGKQAGQFNRQEEEATAAARAKMEGRYSASPVATALAGGVAAPTGNSFLDSLVKSESGGNWNALNSEGYGGRLQFGEARLADAARAGIIPAGMTGAEFSRLSPEQQMAVEQWHFADIDRQAAAMGLDKYIGTTVAGIPITQDAIRGMAHLGGIGGAAKFLQTGGAYNPSDSNGTSLADYAARHGGAPSVATGQNSNEIYSLMADPWVMDQYGSVLGSELAGVQQRENAIFNQQLAMQDPMYQLGLEQKRLELEAMKNPGKRPPIEINGQLVDPDTLQVVGDYRDVKPGWTPMDAETSAALGLDPQKQWQISPEGKIEQIGGGGVNVNIPGQPNIGSIPSGYVAVQDPVTMEWSMKPISGGPAEQELAAADEKAGLAAENAATATSVVTSAAQRAREAAKKRSVGGILGQVAAINPQSENAELYRQVDVLKSNAKVENLNAMRAASPTGGALGSVTEKEADMLAAKSGALDPASKYFDRDLADYELTLLRTIHGNAEGSKIFDQMYPGGIAGITGGSSTESTSTPSATTRKRYNPQTGAFE